MIKRVIKGTNLQIAPIVLGTADFGTAIDKDTAYALLDMFYAQGGTMVDTARVYGNWVSGMHSPSEKLIGRWLADRRLEGQMLLSTKGAHPDLRSMETPRMSRREVEEDLDGSLTDLGVARIDLYWLHRDDTSRPVEEIVLMMNDFVQRGKIRYFGASNWTAARLEAANTFASSHGMQGFCADQLMYSLATVNPHEIGDQTLVAMNTASREYHEKTALPVFAYSSQAGGYFTKLVEHKVPDGLQRKYGNTANMAIFEMLSEMKRHYAGSSEGTLALAYLLGQSKFTCFPIVGCRTSQQLADSLRACQFILQPRDIQRLYVASQHNQNGSQMPQVRRDKGTSKKIKIHS
ncbi:aldo/keto reductase [Bianquea renquensis]|jgi:aldo/keto reductase|uniref:Aldo/keto reductase n=1 Tax=Bianquea renquensis TaxID=2763661 RepID=A0A926DTK8_9FIRM|nr:aldo/keto reductase [Bianquea renquensis]MBC8543119.1 aldo/keto reductase [Bianquea renquensis]